MPHISTAVKNSQQTSARAPQAHTQPTASTSAQVTTTSGRRYSATHTGAGSDPTLLANMFDEVTRSTKQNGAKPTTPSAPKKDGLTARTRRYRKRHPHTTGAIPKQTKGKDYDDSYDGSDIESDDETTTTQGSLSTSFVVTRMVTHATTLLARGLEGLQAEGAAPFNTPPPSSTPAEAQATIEKILALAEQTPANTQTAQDRATGEEWLRKSQQPRPVRKKRDMSRQNSKQSTTTAEAKRAETLSQKVDEFVTAHVPSSENPTATPPTDRAETSTVTITSASTSTASTTTPEVEQAGSFFNGLYSSFAYYLGWTDPTKSTLVDTPIDTTTPATAPLIPTIHPEFTTTEEAEHAQTLFQYIYQLLDYYFGWNTQTTVTETSINRPSTTAQPSSSVTTTLPAATTTATSKAASTSTAPISSPHTTSTQTTETEESETTSTSVKPTTTKPAETTQSITTTAAQPSTSKTETTTVGTSTTAPSTTTGATTPAATTTTEAASTSSAIPTSSPSTTPTATTQSATTTTAQPSTLKTETTTVNNSTTPLSASSTTTEAATSSSTNSPPAVATEPTAPSLTTSAAPTAVSQKSTVKPTTSTSSQTTPTSAQPTATSKEATTPPLAPTPTTATTTPSPAPDKNNPPPIPFVVPGIIVGNGSPPGSGSDQSDKSDKSKTKSSTPKPSTPKSTTAQSTTTQTTTTETTTTETTTTAENVEPFYDSDLFVRFNSKEKDTFSTSSGVISFAKKHGRYTPCDIDGHAVDEVQYRYSRLSHTLTLDEASLPCGSRGDTCSEPTMEDLMALLKSRFVEKTAVDPVDSLVLSRLMERLSKTFWKTQAVEMLQLAYAELTPHLPTQAAVEIQELIKAWKLEISDTDKVLDHQLPEISHLIHLLLNNKRIATVRGAFFFDGARKFFRLPHNQRARALGEINNLLKKAIREGSSTQKQEIRLRVEQIRHFLGSYIPQLNLEGHTQSVGGYETTLSNVHSESTEVIPLRPRRLQPREYTADSNTPSTSDNSDRVDIDLSGWSVGGWSWEGWKNWGQNRLNSWGWGNQADIQSLARDALSAISQEHLGGRSRRSLDDGITIGVANFGREDATLYVTYHPIGGHKTMQAIQRSIPREGGTEIKLNVGNRSQISLAVLVNGEPHQITTFTTESLTKNNNYLCYMATMTGDHLALIHNNNICRQVINQPKKKQLNQNQSRQPSQQHQQQPQHQPQENPKKIH